MKNRFKESQRSFYNRAPNNQTQTRYNRFRMGPNGKLKSGFVDAVVSFEKAMKQEKTLYEKYIGEL